MPELAYRINGWSKRYEVCAKGHAADENTPFSALRHSPLEYVRMRVWGHCVGLSYRRMVKKAWPLGFGMDMACMGLFLKLCELAADQTAEFRGWILDEKQQPMTVESIAEWLNTDIDVVKRCLEILCDSRVGWVDFVEYYKEILTIPGTAGNSPLSGEPCQTVPGKSGSLVRRFPANPGRLINENENETKRREEDSLRNGISDLSSPISFASDSSSAMVRHMNTLDALDKLFPIQTESDRTVIRDILSQVDPGKWETLIREAEKSRLKNKPMAWFTAAAKHMGYKPGVTVCKK